VTAAAEVRTARARGIARIESTRQAAAWEPAGGGLLERNRAYYESLVELILRVRHRVGAEGLLRLISEAAWFATSNHPGYFADARLENLALRIGTELDERASRQRVAPLGDLPEAAARRSGRRRCVLHVASEVAGIGGHTRTIKNWVLADEESAHWLLLTDQLHEPVPAWLAEAIATRGGGGRVIVLPWQSSLLARAAWLRQAAAGADLVVCHHFAEDVVPTVALACPGGPPVALLNQSDHVFWLGASVADTVLNLRWIGLELSRARRGTRHQSLLPIPLDGTAPPATSQAEARRALGIPADATVLLSVGRELKYVPSETHNFFRAARRILDRSWGARVYVVGVPPEYATRYTPGGTHERLHCVGRVEDASLYRAAADVYLEGFPFGSQTAMLEAALAGLPPVPAFAPATALVATSDEALDGLVRTPADEDAYVRRACELIANPALRYELGAACRRRVLECHTGDGWRRRLAGFYAEAESLPHAPGPTPRVAPEAGADDHGLSLFHAFHTRGGGRGADLRRAMRSAAFQSAYQARRTGDCRGAAVILREAGRAWGYDRQLVGSMVKLAPHRLMRLFCSRREIHEPSILSPGCAGVGGSATL
jgi:glycosyltransferase involved in cell wall biosynthesis